MRLASSPGAEREPRPRPPLVLIALAVLAAAAFAAVTAGVVELPDLEGALEDLTETLGTWTYGLVAAMAFLETGAFVGLVAPGETAMVAGGVFAGQGQIDIVVLVALVWACAVAGDSVSFLLGRKLGRGFILRHGPRFRITPERLERVEAFFARHGGKTVLVGRFIGLVRAVAPFIAGASKMSYARFLPYDIAGAGLWAAAFTILGYVSWRNIDRAAKLASTGGLALGTLIVLVVAAALARQHLRSPEQRAKARAWIRARTGRGAPARQ